jgi:MoaA/NifB/PqqE/SkfB family radical SAM enzyme
MMKNEINLLQQSDVRLNADDLLFIEKVIVGSPIFEELLDFTENLSDQEIYWLKKNPRSIWYDYIEYRFKFKFNKENRIVSEAPIYLLIEPTSVCNLTCPMCFQDDESFTTKSYMGMMQLDMFKEAITQANKIGVKTITLASRGEPTLHPQLPEMLEFMKGKFLDIKLNTNGTKLNEKISRSIIENGVNEIVFSIDSGQKEIFEKLRYGAKFEKVLENVKNFVKIRAEYEGSKTLMRISGVKILEEQDWENFVEFWGPFFDQAGWVPAENRWDTYNNSKSSLTTPCGYLWERMYLWFDGKVNPCDVDYKSILSPGKFPDKSLMELWNNQKYMEVRSKHLALLRADISPCDRCGVS